MRSTRIYALLVLVCFTTVIFAYQDEDVATYAVRWQHGATTDTGVLKITTSAILFIGDDGENKALSYLHMHEAKIVDRIWIQVRTNQESGISLGLDDVYNFGVIGGEPDAKVIERINQLILGSKSVRVAAAEKLPGEIARYMVSKGETVGDDVGLLIITEENVMFRSDTAGSRDHVWKYSDLKGLEISRDGLLTLRTTERAIIKAGLSTRNYPFISHTEPFKGSDIGIIVTKIMESR